MNNKYRVAALLVFLAVMVFAPTAFAAEAAADGRYAGFFSYIALGCVVGLGLAAAGCGAGMGVAVSGAVNAMARNPGFYGKIFMNMMIGLALIESCIIYTLVVVLLLLFANPLM